jgi:hypothetical protein
MQLRSTVVLDQTFDVGKSYHITGTPSAVLIDSNMRIASNVAVGGAAILALANADQVVSNGAKEAPAHYRQLELA